MALCVGWCFLIISATYGIFGEAATIGTSSGNVQDSTLARLAKLEAKLETVLEKNVELEQRIEILEKENEHLKDLTNIETDDTQAADDVDIQEVKERTQVRSGIQQRSANVQTRGHTVQRMLLSGEETVGFTATLQSTMSHLGPAQTVVFDHVVSNIGNAYNNVTGIFTAPIGGVYVFSFTSRIAPGGIEYVDLMVNGKCLLQNFASAVGDSHSNSNSRTVVLRVDQGATVWVGHETGSGTVQGNHHSSFAGWLIAITE